MKRAALVLAAAAALFFLYFFGLTRTGLIGPDEPRYAAIGRAMAATGDWITPRLWGAAWFEKPALLYWMTAAGFKLGLGPDLAPRLPVALASVAFLIYFFVALRREFGDRAAWYSAAILATSAGWLAYSHVAITDLPMSAAFGAAMFALIAGRPGARTGLLAGALLGLAVLAKGLVPLVLFIPALWFLRRRIRDLAILFTAAIVVATPWYALVTFHNGTTFLNEFIWKHHFGRFLNNALQHERPLWFYVPVLLAALFPWTPLLALLFQRRLFQDRRALFLAVWFAWGFLFFSISRNKLPGYLLPLLPPLAALMGIALASAARARWVLPACGLLLCLVPGLAGMLPQALAAGISHASFHLSWPWAFVGVGISMICAFLCRWGRLDGAVGVVAAGTTIFLVGVIWQVYPELDRQLSGREAVSMTCLPPMNRSQRYSTEYYAGKDLPDCK
jgi:4-amino-4-deoxy-L-arabinose transferase-like glycosyltransferase